MESAVKIKTVYHNSSRIVSCIKKIPVDLLTQEELLAFSIYPWLK